MRRLAEPRQALLTHIKREGQVTVDQAVAHLGASKNTVRMHLLELERRGLLERVEAEAQGRGRPPLTFRLSPSAGARFPKSDGQVLTQLLTYLEARGAEDLVIGFFEQMWQERRADYEIELEARGQDAGALEARLDALIAVLEAHHFMPRSELEGGRLRIHECNCPFPAAVRATRVPCQLEARFLEEVIGYAPSRVHIATSEAERCRFEWDDVRARGSERRRGAPHAG